MGVGGNGVREVVGGWVGGMGWGEEGGFFLGGRGGGKGSPDAKVTSEVKSSEPPG